MLVSYTPNTLVNICQVRRAKIFSRLAVAEYLSLPGTVRRGKPKETQATRSTYQRQPPRWERLLGEGPTLHCKVLTEPQWIRHDAAILETIFFFFFSFVFSPFFFFFSFFSFFFLFFFFFFFLFFSWVIEW